MTRKLAAILSTVVVSALATVAWAQSVAPKPAVEEDHGAHHPAETAQAPSTASSPAAAPAGPGMMNMGQMGSMMGGGMMPMMSRMMSGSMGQPFEHVEGRIAFLRAELKITDAQLPQWTAFADAMRTQAARMRAEHERMMPSGGMPAGGGPVPAGMPMGMGSSGGMASAGAMPAWPDRLARQQAMLATRIEALKALEAAARPLYTVLTDTQKAMADRLLSGPMGMM